jgi:hypothetical protein
LGNREVAEIMAGQLDAVQDKLEPRSLGDGALCNASGSYQDMALAISLKHNK